MTPDDPLAARPPSYVDENTLRLMLRAVLAEFKLDFLREIDERLKDTVNRREHGELIERVVLVENDSDSHKAWRNRITGGLAIVSVLAVSALTLAIDAVVKHL